MLDLRQYPSLGAALRDALERWPNETCLIEADRDKEKTRLTYSDFKELARPLTRALQDADFRARRSRRHHHDQPVQVADLGLCHLFLRRRSGAAGLQTHRRRTTAIARPLRKPNF